MRDKPIDSLNMVPFIDIMLVLLTIVLTTSSFIASGRIPVQLPHASGVAAANTPSTQTIVIDAAGTVFFGGQAIGTEALAARLAAMPKDTPFLLQADRTVPLQRFIDVVDVLKQLDFARVAVQTRAAVP